MKLTLAFVVLFTSSSEAFPHFGVMTNNHHSSALMMGQGRVPSGNESNEYLNWGTANGSRSNNPYASDMGSDVENSSGNPYAPKGHIQQAAPTSYPSYPSTNHEAPGTRSNLVSSSTAQSVYDSSAPNSVTTASADFAWSTQSGSIASGSTLSGAVEPMQNIYDSAARGSTATASADFAWSTQSGSITSGSALGSSTATQNIYDSSATHSVVTASNDFNWATTNRAASTGVSTGYTSPQQQHQTNGPALNTFQALARAQMNGTATQASYNHQQRAVNSDPDNSRTAQNIYDSTSRNSASTSSNDFNWATSNGSYGNS